MGKLLTHRGTITGLHSLLVRMLHIFKDHLIIGKHLDLGGSDFDGTSRSTLAVSNSTALGLVGDSPHASASSSVRDLPHSSTSSASIQEQSSPDSGT